MRVLIPHADVFNCARGDGVEGAVGEGTALAGWVLAFGGWFEGREIRDVGGWEFDLGLLFGGFVGGGRVGGEGVLDVLLLGLVDCGGKGMECGEDVVGDSEGDFGGWCERRREMDQDVFGWAMEL